MIRLLTVACILLIVTVVPARGQQRVSIDMGQAEADETVNQVIVYGDDPCPASDSGDIIVCARKPEEERYRIPEPLRDVDRPRTEAWTNKIADYERYNDNGPMRCNTIGGGTLGCLNQFIDKAFRERKNSPEARYAQLIQAEREKRLAGIDGESGAAQNRVDDAERAYLNQQKRQSEAAMTKDTVAASIVPVPE